MPVVYRKSDAGAPTVIGATKDERVLYFFDLLKATLVTGYSGQPAAGWSVIDEDTTPSARKLALTNQHQTGVVLLEQQSTDDNYVGVTVYDSMTDVSTGVNGKTYNKLRDTLTEPLHYIYPLDYRNNYDWMIVADPHTFVFATSDLADVGSDYNNGWFYCGEYITLTGALMPPHAHGNFIFAGGRAAGYSVRSLSNTYYISLSRYPSGQLTTETGLQQLHFPTTAPETEYGGLVLHNILVYGSGDPSIVPAHSTYTQSNQCLGMLRALGKSMTAEYNRIKRWHEEAVHTIMQPITLGSRAVAPLAQATYGIFCSLDETSWAEGGF